VAEKVGAARRACAGTVSPPICPNCGLDLATLEPVESGRYRYSESDGFAIDGVRLGAGRVGINRSHHELLGMLLYSRGQVVRYGAIMERLGAEWTEPCKAVAVLLCRIRRAFNDLGITAPIETVHGRGLRWSLTPSQAPPPDDANKA
jgi:hypothetical protein